MYVYFGFCHQQHDSGPTLETIGLAADVEAHAVLVSAAVSVSYTHLTLPTKA